MVDVVKHEDKFVVFKRDDLDSVLQKNPLLDEIFQTVCSLVKLHRIAHNKKPENSYFVCNVDEPYAELVWQIILDGERKKGGL